MTALASTTRAAAVLPWQVPSGAPRPAPSATKGMTRRIRKDEAVFAENDDATHVYRVVSGAVRTLRLLSDGRRQVNEFHFAGDVFGLEGGDEYQCSAEAIEDTVIAVYPRRIFESVSPADVVVSGQLVAALGRSLSRAREHMLLLGCKTAIEKITAFLLSLADRLKSSILRLPMTRQDIADHLGLTIETVSRSFTHLEREGLIEAGTDRRSIMLRDVRRLRQIDA